MFGCVAAYGCIRNPTVGQCGKVVEKDHTASTMTGLPTPVSESGTLVIIKSFLQEIPRA